MIDRDRRATLAAAALALAGCMEDPSSRDGAQSDGDGGENDTANGTDDASGTPDGTTGGSTDGTAGGEASDANASGDASAVFAADVRFRTDRVHDAVNTFDVSVRVDLKDSDRVRVSVGRQTTTYERSGTYEDVARTGLGTNLMAEARTDDVWSVVERGEVPIRSDADG